jgi:hypothetical protein
LAPSEEGAETSSPDREPPLRTLEVYFESGCTAAEAAGAWGALSLHALTSG